MSDYDYINRNIVANGVNHRYIQDNQTNSNQINWGTGAARSMYHVTVNQHGTEMSARSLLNSRLWHGVPQLSQDQLTMFEAAYTGHTFIFCVNMPRFMTEGYYEDTNLHYQMKNLKAVIERASTGFSGVSPIVVNATPQEDGAERQVSHVTSVTKAQSNISLKLHEFAGLPVKNALEAWVTGIYDYRSQHGNYHGNLGITGGWCLRNHSMSILVVQVTPDWTTIQDAAYYFNMVPSEVPFSGFEWTKGEQTIIDDYDIDFYANEERSPAIMYAAEKYMNNRILSMVSTSVYNSKQFVAFPYDQNYAVGGFNGNISTVDGSGHGFIDNMQYNQYITNANAGANKTENDTFIKNDKFNNVSDGASSLNTKFISDNTSSDSDSSVQTP